MSHTHAAVVQVTTYNYDHHHAMHDLYYLVVPSLYIVKPQSIVHVITKAWTRSQSPITEVLIT